MPQLSMNLTRKWPYYSPSNQNPVDFRHHAPSDQRLGYNHRCWNSLLNCHDNTTPNHSRTKYIEWIRCLGNRQRLFWWVRKGGRYSLMMEERRKLGPWHPKYSRKNNPEPRGAATNREYKYRIRAFEEQIAQLRRDILANQGRQKQPKL